MTNDEGSTNARMTKMRRLLYYHWDLVIRAKLGISSYVILSISASKAYEVAGIISGVPSAAI